MVGRRKTKRIILILKFDIEKPAGRNSAGAFPQKYTDEKPEKNNTKRQKPLLSDRSDFSNGKRVFSADGKL